MSKEELKTEVEMIKTEINNINQNLEDVKKDLNTAFAALSKMLLKNIKDRKDINENIDLLNNSTPNGNLNSEPAEKNKP